MKIIKYNYCTNVNYGTDDAPKWEEIITPKSMQWNKENEAIARGEAKDGKIEIVDDGLPDPEEIPDRLDQVEAQIAYTAMMTGTLMNGGAV